MTELDKSENCVVLRGVRQGYRGRTVLDGLDLTLGIGVTALVGPDGAGKSTLLNTVTTVLAPLAGRVEIAGQALTDARSMRAARQRIGFLAQDFGADPRFSVRDFVTNMAWLREIPVDDLGNAVTAAIEAVGLTDRERTRFKNLSGGMRQRAGIAGAIVGNPAVIVLDEPTDGLDAQQRLRFRSVLRDLSGACVLVGTHLIEDVAAAVDRVLLLDAGRIRFDGTVDELRRVGAGPGERRADPESACVRLIDGRERVGSR